MATRKEILELLANGKITANEAADMLTNAQPEPVQVEVEKAPEPPKAVEIEIEDEPTAPQVTKADITTGEEPRWFKVRVRNKETGKNKVSVNIPVRMLKFGMKIGQRFAPELNDLKWDDINGMMSDLQTGMLVEVEDEDSNEHVQVFIE